MVNEKDLEDLSGFEKIYSTPSGDLSAHVAQRLTIPDVRLEYQGAADIRQQINQLRLYVHELEAQRRALSDREIVS